MLAFVNEQMSALRNAQGASAPKVEPIEQLLEGLAISQGLPAFGSAYGLAQGRAALAGAQNAQTLERAKAGLQYGTSALNSLLDRDAALDSVQARITMAESAGRVRQTLAQLRNNTSIIREMAKLSASGGLTLPSLTLMFQNMGSSAEEAGTLAQGTYEQYLADPSLQMRIKQDELALKQGAQMDQNVRKDLGIASGDGNFTSLENYRARKRLKELYLSDPSQWARLVEYNQPDAVLLQEAELLSERGRLAANQASVKETEGKIKKEMLKALPEEMADKHARIWAQINYWKEQERNADLSLDEKISNNARNARIRLFGQSLAAVRSDLGNVTNDITSTVSNVKSATQQLQAIYGDPLLYGPLKDRNGDPIKGPDGNPVRGPRTPEARDLVDRLTRAIRDGELRLNGGPGGEPGLRERKRALLELSGKTRLEMEASGVIENKPPDTSQPRGGGERQPSRGERRYFNPKTGKAEPIRPKDSASRAGTRGGRGNAVRERNRSLGQEKAAAYGWTGDEWEALDELMNKESGWDHNAQNPKSTAYGIGQFLDRTWKGVGMKKTSDPGLQIDAMLKYIKKGYGTPSRALRFHRANNYY